MSRKHTDGLKQRVEAVQDLSGKFFVTRATHGVAPPYVVAHPAGGVNTQERVTGPYSTKNPEYVLHVVGTSGEQAQTYADLLEDALYPGGRGVVIDVDGEKGNPLWFQQPVPIQVQDDPKPSIAFAVIEVGWRSDPV